jgi:hypothetical protein
MDYQVFAFVAAALFLFGMSIYNRVSTLLYRDPELDLG